jgi:hypothetical protein
MKILWHVSKNINFRSVLPWLLVTVCNENEFIVIGIASNNVDGYDRFHSYEVVNRIPDKCSKSCVGYHREQSH